jgi:hypothetical protein
MRVWERYPFWSTVDDDVEIGQAIGKKRRARIPVMSQFESGFAWRAKVRGSLCGQTPSSLGLCPVVTGQSPIDFLPPSRRHPLGSSPLRYEIGAEPSGEFFHPSVAACRVSDDSMEIEVEEPVLEQCARHLDRQAVASPIVGRQLDPQNGGPLISFGFAQTGASTQASIAPLEDPNLKILAWILVLPGNEEIEELLRPLLIGAGEIVEPPIAWVHLIRDEGPAIRFQKIAQGEPRSIDVHGAR